MYSVVALVNKLFPSKLNKDATSYKQRQDLLLEQLRTAQDLHTRQLILDKMMSEDLLVAVDLSSAQLHDIHLESANLEHANLCKAELPDADFEGANLRYALLSEANMKNATLVNANLTAAQLVHVQLEGAVLANATLTSANLDHGNLRGASLYDAELTGAHLDHVDLRGCCLANAKLERVSLEGARFDETTMLPNSEQWTLGVDMRQFTDVSNPEFVLFGTTDTPALQEITPVQQL